MSIHKIKKDNTMNSNNIKLSNHNKILYGIDTIDDVERNSSFYRNQTNFDLIHLFNKYYNSDNYTNIDTSYKAKIKIVIYNPPLDYDCGGIMVMYNLAKSINDLKIPNLEAFIYSYDHRVYKNDFCNNFFNPFFIDDKTIVIYPETIKGNPLAAKHVVRWILLDLGLEVSSNHYNFWDKTDLVYHWEPTNLKYSKQLVNIWVNPEVKKINKTNRSNKTCFGYKKVNNLPETLHSINYITKIHDDNSECIDKKTIKEIIEIFNRSEIFYCYDPNTFFSIMAPLCGCVTVLHPVENTDKNSYFKSRILGHPNGFILDAGIAYGCNEKEIQRARDSLPNIYKDFEKLNNLYFDTIKSFIEDMQNLVLENNQNLYNTVNKIYYNE